MNGARCKTSPRGAFSGAGYPPSVVRAKTSYNNTRLANDTSALYTRFCGRRTRSDGKIFRSAHKEQLAAVAGDVIYVLQLLQKRAPRDGGKTHTRWRLVLWRARTRPIDSSSHRLSVPRTRPILVVSSPCYSHPTRIISQHPLSAPPPYSFDTRVFFETRSVRALAKYQI